MELVRILRVLWKRKRWVFAAAIPAVIVAIPIAYKVSFSPFGLHAKGSSYAAANTTVLIDRPRSALADTSADVLSLSIRAAVYAQFSQSGPVIQAAASAAGIQPYQIATAGPYTNTGGQLPSEMVANQLIGQGSPYRMNFEAADPTVAQIPTLSIFAQAPTPRIAQSMANGAVAGLENYINNAATSEKVFPANRIVIRQLAPARGAVVAASVGKSVAVLAALGVWVVLCLLIIAIPAVRRMWSTLSLEEQGESSGKAAGAEPAREPPLDRADHDTVTSPARGAPLRKLRMRSRAADDTQDSKPSEPPVPVSSNGHAPVHANGGDPVVVPEHEGDSGTARHRKLRLGRRTADAEEAKPGEPPTSVSTHR